MNQRGERSVVVGVGGFTWFSDADAAGVAAKTTCFTSLWPLVPGEVAGARIHAVALLRFKLIWLDSRTCSS
jgi:hypothetical protein